ncbi:hypothetical protein BT69DRAFT_1336234 [Atractiella rhizophila]|nr:hypothetical protein BT69DRAFT_1336234 [Atractiella rhizophila]
MSSQTLASSQTPNQIGDTDFDVDSEFESDKLDFDSDADSNVASYEDPRINPYLHSSNIHSNVSSPGTSIFAPTPYTPEANGSLSLLVTTYRYPSHPRAPQTSSNSRSPHLKGSFQAQFPVPTSPIDLPPCGLRTLSLSHLCPLPRSISDYPLPPLLEQLKVVLAPFSAGGTTSTLSSPLDLSHLTKLTYLELDGGEETSDLASRRFFSTLKSATAIYNISLTYCGLVDFPDFVH